jgi:hypothetical protein
MAEGGAASAGPDRGPRLRRGRIREGGNYVVTACAFTGIAESTLYAWSAEATQPGARPRIVEFDRVAEGCGRCVAAPVGAAAVRGTGG